jgi:dipeptidyl aminopeptidase/acylaminoacyl peptidase
MGSPETNARTSIPITRQTGHVQTPSASPDGREIVYLSDNGGHGNLWIARSDGSETRQLTFERDAAVSVGAPLWSPDGSRIAFYLNRGKTEIWVIAPDGRDRRLLVRGIGACWSPDGDWLYYMPIHEELDWQIHKIALAGGDPIPIRTDERAHAPSPARDGLYYAARVKADVAHWNWEIRHLRPETGTATVLARIDGARLPLSPMFVSTCLSPDGALLVLPMLDGSTTNLWAIPTDGGPMRPLTDFGDRPTIIARQVSWAQDGRHLYAALAETSADVILFGGLSLT